MKEALKSMAEIRERIAKAGSAVLMSDFDGTLAEIVDDPRNARMDEMTRRALAHIVKYIPVAIVTGRSLADIRRRVIIPGISFAGNHGFEWLIDDEEGRAPDVSAFLDGMRRRLQLVTQQFDGTFIEDKGYTLSLHYRHAPEKEHDAIRKAVRSAAREAGGIRVIEGILVDNILPAESRDKGKAAKMMFERLARTKKAIPIFIGDDATDEDAFKALKRGIAVRIGKAEKSAAAYSLKSQKDVAAFLQGLAE